MRGGFARRHDYGHDPYDNGVFYTLELAKIMEKNFLLDNIQQSYWANTIALEIRALIIRCKRRNIRMEKEILKNNLDVFKKEKLKQTI